MLNSRVEEARKKYLEELRLYLIEQLKDNRGNVSVNVIEARVKQELNYIEKYIATVARSGSEPRKF